MIINNNIKSHRILILLHYHLLTTSTLIKIDVGCSEVNLAYNDYVIFTKQNNAVYFSAEYTLHYKTDDGNWQHERLSSDADKHTLRNLRCGTRYHLYMTASNSLGTGEPSEAVPARTKGAGTAFLSTFTA